MRKFLRDFAIAFVPLMFLTTLTKETPAIAQSDPQKFVESVKSVEQVKSRIANLIRTVDDCSVGSCFNNNSTGICELVAALDVQVNGQILGEVTAVTTPPKIPISKSDLSLMREIFSQCKPTNYQYWNFSSMLHVYYVPKPEVDQRVRQALGVPAKKRR